LIAVTGRSCQRVDDCSHVYNLQKKKGKEKIMLVVQSLPKASEKKIAQVAPLRAK
jgi:hypothetical protein